MTASGADTTVEVSRESFRDGLNPGKDTMEVPTYGVIHEVFRVADGKNVGSIYAVWAGDGSGGRFPGGVPHGGTLVSASRFTGRVPQGALDLFRWNATPAGLAASDKYTFSPSPF